MKKVIYDEALLQSMTEEQLEETIQLTRAEMKKCKRLALIFYCCLGIGILLPFGMRAVSYAESYGELVGEPTTSLSRLFWRSLGIFVSLVGIVLDELGYPKMIASRMVVPDNVMTTTLKGVYK